MGAAPQSIYQDGTYLEQTGGSWHAEDSPWKAALVLDLLAQNDLRPRTLAEIGCGAGEILNLLRETLPETELHGWDVSPQAYELCRPKERERLHFHLGDLLEEDVTYDVFVAADVFEHVPDYLGFLERLRPRAQYKVFHIPLGMSVLSVLRSQPLRARREVGHLHYFDASTALATLEDAGYRVLSQRYTAGCLELARAGWRPRLARFPRWLLHRASPAWAARLLTGFSLLVLAE